MDKFNKGQQHKLFLQRNEKGKDANITVLSVGGCGCTYVLDQLQKFYPDLKVNKRHLVTEELLYKPEHKFIYIYNDPLLSLISRFNRNILYRGWAQWKHTNSIHIKKLKLPKAVNEEIYNNFKVFDSFVDPVKIKTKNGIGRLSPEFEQEFAKMLFKTCIQYKTDCYGIESHFNCVYKIRNKIDVSFLDFRDPDISSKLTKITKKPIEIKIKKRNSGIKNLAGLGFNVATLVDIYSKLDNKIKTFIYS